MPISLEGAFNNRPKSAPNVPKLELEEGSYEAHFIGLGEPFLAFNSFKGCRTCGVPVEGSTRDFTKGSGLADGGRACVNCDGTGLFKEKQVALRYVIDHTNEEIQESVGYKLSAPFQMAGGRVSSPSKLYSRFKTFSGESTEEAIVDWANRLPEEVSVPVMLIVKPTSTGKSMKISDVIKTKFTPRKSHDDSIPS